MNAMPHKTTMPFTTATTFRTMTRSLMLACTALLLAGCLGGGSNPNLFVLNVPETGQTNVRTDKRIGLAEVSLPAYARKQAIINLTGTHRIKEDDDNRWANPPAEAISTALAHALEARLGTAVVQRPYPRSLEPTVQVRVALDKLLRGQDGSAQMQGQFLIVSEPTDEVVHIERFSLSKPAPREGYGGYMAAVQDSVNDLSRLITQAINRME